MTGKLRDESNRIDVERYKVYRVVYELLMVSLVVVSIGLFWVGDSEIGKLLTRLVWGIFFIDVSVRLYLSRSRLMYFVKNPFDIVSVIPLDEFMLFARFARVIDLFRMKTILGRYVRPITGLLNRINIKELFVGVSMTLLLVVCMLRLVGFGMMESIRFVGMHFVKFNHELTVDGFWYVSLAIFIKMLGMIVFGTLISRLLLIIGVWLDERKKRKQVVSNRDDNE